MSKSCRLLLVSCAVFSLLVPLTARADVIDNILMLIDEDLATARPMIDCMVSGTPADVCAAQLAGQAASEQVSTMLAQNSSLVLAVDIIKAATRQPQGDWVKVLELTGVDLTFKIGCKVGVPTGGPVKSFICGPLFQPVLAMAKPVVRDVLVAVRDKDWLRLVALLGPTQACEIIPTNDPVSASVCGVLGEILNALGGAAGEVAGAAWGQIEDWSEDLQGQTQHMSYDEFYARYLRHLVHKRALQRLMVNRSGLGLDPNEFNSCVKYFDNHKQANDTAHKTCTDLGNRLHKESEIFISFVETAPPSYFDAYLKPGLADLVAERYWSDEVADYQSYIFPLPPQKWGMGNFPASQNRFFGDYNTCFAGMHQIVNNGNPYPAFPELAPDSVRDWACYQSAGLLYAKALTTEKLRLLLTVKPQLAAAGCSLEPKSSNSDSVSFMCGSFDGYKVCKQSFNGYRYEHCRIDKLAADKTFGEKLVNALGSKRCKFVETYASKEGYYNPKVACSREWKNEQCQQLREMLLQDPVIANHPFGSSLTGCEFYPESLYLQAKSKANQIIGELNTLDAPPGEAESPVGEVSAGGGGVASGLKLEKSPSLSGMSRAPERKKLASALLANNCRSTWDPLAITCSMPSVVSELPERLPGVTLPQCPPDPGKDGADAPCYAGVLPVAPPADGTASRLPGRDASRPAPGRTKESKDPGSSVSAARKVSEAPREQIMLRPLPDLVAADQFTVAGQPARWGIPANIRADSLLPGPAGGCQVPVVYRVENRGTAMSPAAAQDLWTVTGRHPDVRGTAGRIEPKQGRQQEVTLVLYPGENRVSLILDPDRKIEESDEQNNLAQIRMLLSGDCGEKRGGPGMRTAPSPVPGKAAPMQTTPAVLPVRPRKILRQ